MRRALAILLSPLLLSAAPAAAETLLVGNKSEDTLSVIGLDSGAELARLPTGKMPHEIAISPDGKRAAVVAYGGTTIDIFDVAARTKVKTIDLSPNQRPHGLLWLSDGRLVATAEGSESIAVVAPDGTVTSIATGQKGSHMVVVAPGNRTAYVANIGSGTVSVLDLADAKKLRDLPVGGKPEGLALAKGGRELWVGDLSAPRVQIWDTAAAEKIAEQPVDPVAIRVLASPDGKLIATSNIASGTISLFDAGTRALLRTIIVSGDEAKGQVTLLFSADSKRLYAAETGHDQVAEIDVASGKLLRRIAAGKNGDGLAIAP
ncbi:YVTN family beta-propeller protein [Sphingopyxis panaciterrae]|uniref:YVTN family beta-propeller repeat protein n=1 Tax=Sphingopyxis panaciterrae TaxID=363841 RepID=UPI00141E64E9|nr:LpqB family beta-propeller domain-containing protein [Sphingopyxis panaciterrae]NIJ35467.1 YVTN family beta-propeller protein [Sphingopyxis panaciterrae]